MKAPFSLFLALRYLKPKRTFVSVITVISVAGVTLGIMALIVVIAVMTGFDKELRKKVLGFEAHLTISKSQDVMQDWEPVREKLDHMKGVTASSPFVMGPVMLQYETQYITAKMRGVDLASEEKIANLKEFVKQGQCDLDGDKCLMGEELARALGIGVGDKLFVHGAGNLKEAIEELKKAESNDPEARKLGDIKKLIQPLEVEVTGLFTTGRYQYDSEFIILPLSQGQDIYGIRGCIHGITLRTEDPYWADAAKPDFSNALGPEFSVSSWIDQNVDLFDAIRIERATMFIILLLIIVVAAFSITNTLITVIVQKKREIGIIKALGATRGQIIGVFLGQGAVVGILGNLVGLAAGFGLLHWRNEARRAIAELFGIQLFPNKIYQFSEIPASIDPSDVAIICTAGFIICLIAALIPAWFAARLDPVKALRDE